MSNFSATDEFTSIAAALSGQYEVEREIGRGGMGVVYLARDLRLDRMVAIKTLPAQLASDAAVRERFLREARTAARLSHANIVPIHRADEIGGQVFFVMGFIDGDSLAAKLAANGPLSPRDAVPILRDVTAALGYAHRHGVVHRDVKTENVLLDAATGRAMVTDFGIARVTEAAPLTATGQVLGTVYYLSPEQVTGDTIDARSDIYALGIVGYAALAGKFPFDGPLASAVLVAHVNKRPVSLSAAAPNVPASLGAIIDRCLAKDPADRFQSCAELDDALAVAQRDADRVATSANPQKPILVSDSEAHALFQRAAELQDMTGVVPRPALTPKPRNPIQDAQRTSGFKTANLRDAAIEAGIDEKYLDHALVERGLRPPPKPPARPDPLALKAVRDLTKKPLIPGFAPTQLRYEMVVDGEVPADDFDLFVDVIRQNWEADGTVESVGRSLSWRSRTAQGSLLDVAVLPRHGQTTMRVHGSLKSVTDRIYIGAIGAIGFGLGGTIFGSMFANGTPIGYGIGMWAASMMFAIGGSFVATKVMSYRTQSKMRKTLEDLAAQALESIHAAKK